MSTATPPKIRDLAAENMNVLWGRASKIALPIAAVGSFVADVLAPLGPIVAILMFTTLFLCVISGVAWFGVKRRQIRKAMANGEISREEFAQIASRDTWSVMFAFNLMATIVLMLFFGAQKALAVPDKNTGAIAGAFPWVEQMQSRLLKIERATERIVASTERIDESTQKIEASNERLEKAIAELGNRFQNINKGTSMVAAPKSPEDHYQNARILEMRGDYMNARKSYLSYIKGDLPYVDPHLAFSTLLKLQDGRDSAVESYGVLIGASENPAARLARALLLDRERKLAALTDITIKSPEFAPAFYYLAKEYSVDGTGQATIANNAKEKELIGRFRELSGRGLNTRYFLDKRPGLEIEADAEKRWRSLSNLAKSYLESPVKVTVFTGSEGPQALVLVGESAEEIFVQLPGESEYKSTGFSTVTNQQTGKPVPESKISLGKLEKKGVLRVKYRDPAGAERGPFDIDVDPSSEFVKVAKMSLSKSAPASVSRSGDRVTIAPGSLMVFRNAIAKATMGPAPGELNTEVKLPRPSGGAGFRQPSSEDAPYYSQVVPAEWKKIYMKIYYTDGSSSEPVALEK